MHCYFICLYLFFAGSHLLFWTVSSCTVLEKNLSVVDFISYILCKSKWSCLHQDIKSLHSMWVSRICRARSQKALCLQWNVALSNCLFSLLEENLSSWSFRAILMVQKAIIRHLSALEVKQELLSMCSYWCCAADLIWEREVNQPWMDSLALATKLKIALVYLYIYMYVYGYVWHSGHFWDGGFDLKYEIRQWQPSVDHTVSQELKVQVGH